MIACDEGVYVQLTSDIFLHRATRSTKGSNYDLDRWIGRCNICDTADRWANMWMPDSINQ